jgi:hypothetical protein
MLIFSFDVGRGQLHAFPAKSLTLALIKLRDEHHVDLNHVHRCEVLGDPMSPTRWKDVRPDHLSKTIRNVSRVVGTNGFGKNTTREEVQG